MPTDQGTDDELPAVEVRLSVRMPDGKVLGSYIGSFAADPHHWQAHLADLLRAAADELHQLDADAS